MCLVSKIAGIFAVLQTRIIVASLDMLSENPGHYEAANYWLRCSTADMAECKHCDMFQLVAISSSVLCPRSEKAEGKEAVMRVLCGVLTFLLILIISKLLYDYWNYRQRGKLPWIVYRMP